MTVIKSMRAKSQWATVALALASTCAGGALAAVAPVVPGTYIVEFVDGQSDTSAFYSNLTGSQIDATPRIKLEHELFKGASFKLEGSHDNETTVDTIQSMTMVSKIWPVRLYDRPATLISTLSGVVTESTPMRKRGVVDNYAPHVMGGVDKLHEEGYSGDGIYIGVVDTGVDYNHPALGGGFGPGHKIVAGTDLVGDAYNGNNVPVPDSDPMDCNGHGTHVSGIIGANPNPFNFTGVVPNATMGMWKVFGCVGSVSNDVLIQAFNLAYEAGVDLISSSIGGSSGWTEDPWDVAVQRITEKGVPCIIAAGNDGANGLFDTSNAAEAIGATGVGSIDSITQPALLTVATYTYNGQNPVKFSYAKGKFGDFGTISVPMWALTLDSTVLSDGCAPFPANTPDLSQYVVLIRRGQCTFDTKIANGVAFGAKRFMFYNNVPTVQTSPGDSSTVIPVGMASAAQGAEWVTQLKAGVKVTVQFTALAQAEQSFTDEPNTFTGGKMSTFSSWGPSYEGWIKPEVSAPGGIILSTYPLALTGYAIESGTSMATPYIAGVIALMKQIRGKKTLTPDSLTSLLATTAKPVDFNDGRTTSTFLAPVVQQGGGLVDAFTAAHTTTLLDLENIALNDTSYFKAAQTVTISNIGSSAQTYTFANIQAATAFTLSNGGIVPDLFPPSLAADAASGATIRFDPTSITIPAKSNAQVTFHFTRPAGVDATRIPIYSGFVAINGTNGDTLSLPYAGIASRLKDAKIMNTAAGYPFLASTASTTTPVANGTVFTLPGNSTANPNATFPVMAYSLAMGSRIVRVDVVPENVAGLPRVVGQQILGSVPGYPVENHPRLAADAAGWDGSFADGSRAPAGRYKFMLRALRILGDPTYDHDYERYDSGFFEIKYAA